MQTHITPFVDYVSPEWGLPGTRYFRCAPMTATIAVEACASNWRASLERDSERLLKCRSCPVGAVHAGDTAASLSPLRGMRICSRCVTGTTRLIHEWLCVSCYNREREHIAGRNAKGKAPSRMAPLHRRAIKIVEAGVPRILARDLTTGMEELMVAALRDSRNSVAFGFNGRPSARYGQGVLW